MGPEGACFQYLLAKGGIAISNPFGTTNLIPVRIKRHRVLSKPSSEIRKTDLVEVAGNVCYSTLHGLNSGRRLRSEKGQSRVQREIYADFWITSTAEPSTAGRSGLFSRLAMWSTARLCPQGTRRIRCSALSLQVADTRRSVLVNSRTSSCLIHTHWGWACGHHSARFGVSLRQVPSFIRTLLRLQFLRTPMFPTMQFMKNSMVAWSSQVMAILPANNTTACRLSDTRANIRILHARLTCLLNSVPLWRRGRGAE